MENKAERFAIEILADGVAGTLGWAGDAGPKP